MTVTRPLPLGAHVEPDGVRFRVWAPNASAVDVEVVGRPPVRLAPVSDDGHFEGVVEGIGAGAHYKLRLDGGDAFPDPASRFQPEGVHGPSEVVDPVAFGWTDRDWSPPALEDLVVYELHVGTFTKDGTFDGVRQRLKDLRELGVTAIELMPVADFPGRWNWGYDGAALFAPSRAYGRPDDLRRLVDAAHAEGLAVLLDVVYNHLGPDGAYVAAFGPAFSERHETPWGAAMNLDGPGSAGLRGFFLDNVRHWLEEYHLDGLRLDATHALVDESETHFLEALNDLVRGLDGPPRLLVAEDHRNLNALVRPRAEGGMGLDAVWADDLHHQVRHVLAGDDAGYYASFAGADAAEIAETLNLGWYYDGRPDRATRQTRGTSAEGVGREQCVVCIQNHDQIGNRPTGERLHHEVSAAAYRAATALLLVAPETPMLFQGQEWATSAPFLFFTDHGPDLGPLVTAGRKREFADFPGFSGDVPDPQDPETFRRSVLSWDERQLPGHAHIYALYRRLLALRKTLGDPADAVAEAVGEGALRITRGDVVAVVDLVGGASVDLPAGAEVVLSTEDADVAEDPVPPSRVGDTVRFARPGALVVRVGG